MLFHSTIFGPIHSRRLGTSLGVNLEPDNGKVCSFDCIYCEAGLNKDGREDTQLPTREKVRADLEAFFKNNTEPIDSITFAGNGEPTVHPEFDLIVDDTIKLRNSYMPKAQISVLTNGWQIKNPKVAMALRKVDNNILKLDSAIASSVAAINRPNTGAFDLDAHIKDMSQFAGSCIIQTLFLTGDTVNNTTDAEVDALLKAYAVIQPKSVQIYSLDRKTPFETLKPVTLEFLNGVAAKIKKLGIGVTVTL